jgi:hypothetical protein
LVKRFIFAFRRFPISIDFDLVGLNTPYNRGRRDTEDHDAECSQEFGCVLHRIPKMSGGSWIKRKEGYDCVPGLSKEEA